MSDHNQNETEKTGDTTIRETGHDARSNSNERGVQRAADQAEARAGTLLPEQTPKDAGHLPNGDKAGPQAGQEHVAEKPAASGFEALDKQAESLQAPVEKPSPPSAFEALDKHLENEGMAPRVAPYSQSMPGHADPLLGKGLGYLAATPKKEWRDPKAGEHEDALGEIPPAGLSQKGVDFGPNEFTFAKQENENVAAVPPPRPQVGRDHQAVLDYMVQYTDWRIAKAFAAQG